MWLWYHDVTFHRYPMLFQDLLLFHKVDLQGMILYRPNWYNSIQEEENVEAYSLPEILFRFNGIR